MRRNVAPDIVLAECLFRVLHDESVDRPGVTRGVCGSGEQRTMTASPPKMRGSDCYGTSMPPAIWRCPAATVSARS